MARTNLQIKIGTYTGNATDNTNITGIGFRPKFVMTHRNSVGAVGRVSTIRGDLSLDMASNAVATADWIQEMLSDGFQVGTASNVNTNAVPYYYIAIDGVSAQAYFRAFKFRGDGTDNRNYTGGGLGFTPDFVFVKGDVAQNSSARIAAQVGDLSLHLPGVADATNEIQNLQSGGFQLGSSSRVNAATTDFYGFAMKHVPGGFTTGTFTGTGVAQSITGLGFKPDFLLVKNGTTTNQTVMLTSDMVTASVSSIFLGNGGTVTSGITSLDSNGFTVGTDTSVNGSTNVLYYMAFKTGNYSVPLNRLVL